MNQKFPKAERLTGKKQIDTLFNKGESFFLHPFRVMYFPSREVTDSFAKVLISVPKRNFKKAADRNKIKRLIRECYRKNKYPLVEHCKKTEKCLLVGLLYTDRSILSYAEMESKIILILQRLIEQDEQSVG